MFFYRLKFIDKVEESQGTYTFRFEKPAKMSYSAGQHFSIFAWHWPFDLRGPLRIFTASSAPKEDYFSFTTRYFAEDGSSFKRHLYGMEQGDSVLAFGPSPVFDVFKLPSDYEERAFIFMVGGIGVTPIASIVKSGAMLKGKIIYAHKPGDTAFLGQLKEYSEKNPEVELIEYISPQRMGEGELRSHLQDLQEKHPEVKGIEVKISGSTGFVKNYAAMAKKLKGDFPHKLSSYKFFGFLGGY